jgi:hypothetical protein
MALNIYTETFQKVARDVDKLFKDPETVKRLFANDAELLTKYIIQRGLDPEEFTSAYHEYTAAQEKGITDFRGSQIQLDDDPNLNTYEEILGSLARFGGRTLEEFSEYLKLIPGPRGTPGPGQMAGSVFDTQASLATLLPKGWQEYLDPYHGEGIQGDVESIGAQVATFLPGFGLPGLALKTTGKLSKMQRLGKHGDKIRKAAGSRAGKLGAVGVGSAVHESIINNHDISAIQDIVNTPGGLDLLERIEDNPEDRETYNLLRNMGTNLGYEAAFAGGILGFMKMYKAFKNTQIGNKVTRLGRQYLNTRRGTDDEFLASYTQRNHATQKAQHEADGIASDLKKSVAENDKNAFKIFAGVRQGDMMSKELDAPITNVEDVVSAALRGNREALASLSKPTQKLVGRMRFQIDELSRYLGDNVFTGELSATMSKNLGVYLNRSYRIFDDGSYRKDLKKVADKFVKENKFKGNPKDKAFRDSLSDSERVVADAWHYIKKNFKDMNTDPDVEEALRELVERADTPESLFAFLGIATRGDNLLGTSKVTRKLNNVPREIRALWGEVKTPYADFATTYHKLATMKAEHVFTSDLARKLQADLIAGQGGKHVVRYGDKGAEALIKKEGYKSLEKLADQRAKIVFGKSERPVPKHIQEQIDEIADKRRIFEEGFDQISRQRVRTKAELDDKNLTLRAFDQEMENLREPFLSGLKGLTPQAKDLYVSKEYIDMLEELGKKDTTHALLKFWGAAKGVSQTTKTVYNPATHGRNTMGNMILLAANGMNPFGGTGFNKAFQLTAARLSGQTNEELGKQLGKMVGFGLADSSVTLGLIKANLKGLKNEKGFVNKIGNNKVAQLYEAEDYIFKVMHFEKSLKMLKKAFPNRSIDDLEKMAAQRTRDLMPNYQLVPKAFKAARLSPIGDFIAFPAEMARISKNLVKYSLDDLFSNNPTLQRAAKVRIAGLTSVALIPDIMESVSADIFNISAEQQEALKQTDVPFYKGSPKVFTSGITKNKRGGTQVDVVRIGPTDPFDAVKVAAKLIHEAILSTPAWMGMTKEKMSTLSAKSALASLDRTVSPFVGSSMLTDMILSLDNNPDMASSYPNTAFGDLAKNVARTFDLPTRAGTVMGRIGSAFEPGFITFMNRRSKYEDALEANRRRGDYSGEAYNYYWSPMKFGPDGHITSPEDVLGMVPELVGLGSRPVDISGGFYRNISQHLRNIRTSNQNYQRDFRNPNLTEEQYMDSVQRYDITQRDNKKQAASIRALMEYYRDLGFTEKDIIKSMTMLGSKTRPRDYGKSKEFRDLLAIIRNTHIPTEITNDLIANILLRAGEELGPKITKALNDKERAWSLTNIEEYDRPKASDVLRYTGE